MTLSTADQPQDLPCNVWTQDELNQINDWRNRSFLELIALRSDIDSTNQILNSLIRALPSQICGEVSPRFFQTTRTGTNSASITLPSGGTWTYIAQVFGRADDGITSSGQNINYIFFDTGSDDEILFGATSGVVAGGQTISMSQANFDYVTLSVFAYRTDCP